MRSVLYVVIFFMIAASTSAQEHSVLNVVSAWSSPGLSEQKSVRVDIMSGCGQTLGTGRISKLERSIDVSELSPGIYFCLRI